MLNIFYIIKKHFLRRYIECGVAKMSFFWLCIIRNNPQYKIFQLSSLILYIFLKILYNMYIISLVIIKNFLKIFYLKTLKLTEIFLHIYPKFKLNLNHNIK